MSVPDSIQEDSVTETPIVDEAATAEQEAVEPSGPQATHCRHCGQRFDGDTSNPDWQCPSCERYQDAMICPTCHQTARISLLPSDQVPEPHAPARRRKPKEGD